MRDKVLVDTNILVYAHAIIDPPPPPQKQNFKSKGLITGAILAPVVAERVKCM